MEQPNKAIMVCELQWCTIPAHVWFRFRFRFQVNSKVWFQFRFRFQPVFCWFHSDSDSNSKSLIPIPVLDSDSDSRAEITDSDSSELEMYRSSSQSNIASLINLFFYPLHFELFLFETVMRDIEWEWPQLWSSLLPHWHPIMCTFTMQM